MRKLVPDQNASMAEPCSLTVMIGMAILRDVASRAAARVTRQMEEKARMKRRVGLNWGLGSEVVSGGDSSGTLRLVGALEIFVSGKPSWTGGSGDAPMVRGIRNLVW